jgi:hypothetical protein
LKAFTLYNETVKYRVQRAEKTKNDMKIRKYFWEFFENGVF